MLKRFDQPGDVENDDVNPAIDLFETPAPVEFQVDPDDPGRKRLLQLPRDKSSLQQRLQLMKHRNWADPGEVMEDEASFLRALRALSDESLKRHPRLLSMFGTLAEFDRVWQAYAKWADKDQVAWAEARHRAMSSGMARG